MVSSSPSSSFTHSFTHWIDIDKWETINTLYLHDYKAVDHSYVTFVEWMWILSKKLITFLCDQYILFCAKNYKSLGPYVCVLCVCICICMHGHWLYICWTIPYRELIPACIASHGLPKSSETDKFFIHNQIAYNNILGSLKKAVSFHFMPSISFSVTPTKSPYICINTPKIEN